MTEEVVSTSKQKTNVAGARVSPIELRDIQHATEERFFSGWGELDRVMGGGMVKGGVTLLGGEPGIGKSTLLLQMALKLSEKGMGVLYVTGEESPHQLSSRAERMSQLRVPSKPQTLPKHFWVAAATAWSDIEAAMKNTRAGLVIVDSIQTMRMDELDSAAGSVSQLREVTSHLVEHAKQSNTHVWVVGHVTKDGAIAGPKLLEHLVDTVLAFEGEETSNLRVVRVLKNRFGPSAEMAVYAMQKEGLEEIADPSALFLQERPVMASGSVVTAICQNHKALLIELQALVAGASYGTSRRVSSGVEASRISIVLAVLERKAGLKILDKDVFVSIAAGMKSDDRALDLPLALAIASSVMDKPLPANMLAIGELGLAGEVRSVGRMKERLLLAEKKGFTHAMVPFASMDNVKNMAKTQSGGIKLMGVSDIRSALRILRDEPS